MSSGADLFVVCKTCGSEVSAYVTECPYCGSRLRKRAPKLERPGVPARRTRRPGRGALRRGKGRLGRMRPGEMPGIRFDTRPHVTIGLVAASVAVSLVALARWVQPLDLALYGPTDPPSWRLLVAPFTYPDLGYMLCGLVGIGLFGWLLERRHGWWAPLVLFAAGGAGGLAVAGWLGAGPVGVGGNGASLAMLAAWAVPDLQERGRQGETDSDLLGASVIAAVLLLLPLAVAVANPVAGAAGAVIGLVLGLVLAAVNRAR